MAEDCNRPVSRWSTEERLAWGREENALRHQELALVTDEESLLAAQKRAKKRRNTIGASRGQAVQMVLEAQQDAILRRSACRRSA